MSVDETDNLAALVRRRHACLCQLRDVEQQQLALIRTGELGVLLTLLAGKQRLLATLGEIERQLDPFRGQDPASRHWRSTAERHSCARLAADCESMLAEIVEQEQQSEQEMARRRNQTVGALQRLHSAGAVRGAYAAQASTVRTHLDLTSES